MLPESLQSFLDSPKYLRIEDALEHLKLKVDEYYDKRIEEGKAEANFWQSEACNDWAKGEEERYLNQKLQDLHVIDKFLRLRKWKKPVYPQQIRLLCIYGIAFDAVNNCYRITIK